MKGPKSQSEQERFFAKVEKTETCWNWTAARVANGYASFTHEGGTRAHRFAYTMANGPIPAGMLVDHMCHNRVCVNPAHLRLATPAENSQNRAGATVLSKSGHRGVKWSARDNRWVVTAMKEGVLHRAGFFSDLDEAAAAAVALRASLYAKAA